MQVRKDNIVHSFDEEECTAFVEFINGKLGDDADLAHVLPITEISDLFSAVADGTLLCKLLNVAVPETIDERAVNFGARSTFHFIENQNLVLSAAKSVGLTVVNMGSQDMIEGRPHLVLGLIWQMVKMTLLSAINLKAHPEMIRLLEPGETLEDLLKLPPEKLLLRWVNFHLAAAGHSKRITNFGAHPPRVNLCPRVTTRHPSPRVTTRHPCPRVTLCPRVTHPISRHVSPLQAPT